MKTVVVHTLLLVSLLGSQPAGAKDQAKQTQIDANTTRIESLEAKTTLADLDCATDEVAAFDGSAWGCTSPAELLAIYESRAPVTLVSDPTLPRTETWDAYCDLGDLAIGGGWATPVGSFSYRVVSSHLNPSNSRAWSIEITVAPGTITLDGAVHATCLDRTP